MSMREGKVTVVRAFVDAVEDERATLVIGDQTAGVPAAILPDGVGEGGWIEMRIKAIQEPVEHRADGPPEDGGGDFRL
jgi:hypothetical protein